MATTYTLIASNTLGSTTTTITFNNIPNSYTDLVLRWSARSAQPGSSVDNAYIRFNNDSTYIYSFTQLAGNGSAASSAVIPNDNALRSVEPAADVTANTFSNNELYLPNYNSTTSKPVSIASETENNAVLAFIRYYAGLYRNTSAITRMDITTLSGNGFVANSAFYLYGIKNS